MKRFLKYVLYLTAAFCVWIFAVEPNLLFVRHAILRVPRWDVRLENLKIVLAGDFHFDNLYYSERAVDRIINKINEQNPDIVFFTGDYVTKKSSLETFEINKVAAGFAKIRSKYGVYAVLGNHDYSAGARKIKKAFTGAGVRVLEDASVQIVIDGVKVNIAGVADTSSRKLNLKETFKNVPDGEPCIFLSHNPDIFDMFAPRRFTVMFSGHTHGGQLKIPYLLDIIGRRGYKKKFERGEVRENSNVLYVTSGLGTSVVPARFLVPPEIVVIKLEPEDPAPKMGAEK